MCWKLLVCGIIIKKRGGFNKDQKIYARVLGVVRFEIFIDERFFGIFLLFKV